MGLMDFLQPFAKGYIGARVEQMEALAEEKAEKRKYEDQLKLQNLYSAQAYRKQKDIDYEFIEKEELKNRKLIKTDLLNDGMPAQLLDIIPSRHLASTETYNSFVESEYDGDLNWYKKPMQMPNGDMGTVASFIILGNTNFNNAENAKNNLVGQGGALEGQPNTANAMLEGDKKEEPTLTTELPSMFTQPKELVKTLEGISEDTETENVVPDVSAPSFMGLGTDQDFFIEYDLKTEEGRESRNQNIIKNIANLGGFGEGIKLIDGVYTNVMKFDDVENKRYNAINQLAINYADEFYKENGYSASGNEAVVEAMKINDFITYIAKQHKENILDTEKYPELDQAVKLGVITNSQALEAQLYEDLSTLENLDLGYMPRVYYQDISGFNPTPRKPDWYDTFQDDLDDALLLNTIDETYDVDGEIIVKDDKKKEPKTETKEIGPRVGVTVKTTEKEIEEEPTKAELEIELAKLKKSKKTVANKTRIKQIEAILKSLQE